MHRTWANTSPALIGSCPPGLRAMWTSETADIFDFICSFGSLQIFPSGSHRWWESLKRQLTRSLRKDCLQWCTGKYRNNKKAAAVGHTRSPYRLIKGTGPLKLGLSRVVEEYDDLLTPSQELRLELWVEQLRQQISRPMTKVDSPFSPASELMPADTSTASEIEAIRETGILKRH